MADRLQDRLRDTRVAERRLSWAAQRELMCEAADRIDELEARLERVAACDCEDPRACDRRAAHRCRFGEAGPASTLPDTLRSAMRDAGALALHRSSGHVDWKGRTSGVCMRCEVEAEIVLNAALLEAQARDQAAYRPPMARCDNPDGRCTMREWCTSYDSCWAATDRDTDELPLVPMRYQFPDDEVGFRDAMAEWVRLVLRATNPEQTADAR